MHIHGTDSVRAGTRGSPSVEAVGEGASRLSPKQEAEVRFLHGLPRRSSEQRAAGKALRQRGARPPAKSRSGVEVARLAEAQVDPGRYRGAAPNKAAGKR